MQDSAGCMAACFSASPLLHREETDYFFLQKCGKEQKRTTSLGGNWYRKRLLCSALPNNSLLHANNPEVGW